MEPKKLGPYLASYLNALATNKTPPGKSGRMDQQAESALCNLPNELITLIFHALPILDGSKLLLTCKKLNCFQENEQIKLSLKIKKLISSILLLERKFNIDLCPNFKGIMRKFSDAENLDSTKSNLERLFVSMREEAVKGIFQMEEVDKKKLLPLGYYHEVIPFKKTFLDLIQAEKYHIQADLIVKGFGLKHPCIGMVGANIELPQESFEKYIHHKTREVPNIEEMLLPKALPIEELLSKKEGDTLIHEIPLENGKTISLHLYCTHEKIHNTPFEKVLNIQIKGYFNFASQIAYQDLYAPSANFFEEAIFSIEGDNEKFLKKSLYESYWHANETVPSGNIWNREAFAIFKENLAKAQENFLSFLQPGE